jgi:hypothetical protein
VFYIIVNGWDDNVSKNWVFWTADEYNNESALTHANEQLKEFAWSNICFCDDCEGDDCNKKERSISIFGKVFIKVCRGFGVMIFIDPDAEVLGYLKKLADIRKHNILNIT